MNRKQKIIVSITGIILVSLILIGLTYAYFLTKITGNTNEKSISVSTANLVLEYGENTNVVQGISNAEPGYSVEKIFTATNKGNSSVTYGVALEDIVNGLSRQQDLVYTLTCTSYLKEGFSLLSNGTITGTVDGDCSGVTTEKQFPSTSTLSIMTTNEIDTTHTHAYKLTITYKEMGVDQSEDMGKTFSAKVNIVDLNAIAKNNPYSSNKNGLAYNIIENARTGVNGTELVGSPKTKPASENSSFIYEKGTEPTTFTSSRSSATNYYISYADDYKVDESTGKFTLVNPTIATSKYTTDMANTLVGKYAVWSTSKPTVSNTQNQWTIYKISTNVSDITTTIKYDTINSSSLKMTSTEKELSITTDDYGTSYYYRGEVSDNYVNFAGMCWRVVRIEGDGSIKLILEDQNVTCDDTSYTGNWSIGSAPFGSTPTYQIDYLNQESSSNALVNKFKDFQKSKLSNHLEKLKVDKWCYDDNVASTASNGDEYYGAYKRIYTDESPSLVCSGTKLTKYKDGTSMYVGTLTADEISFAGAKDNTIYYLINSYSHKNYLSWWSLSPAVNIAGAYKTAYKLDCIDGTLYSNSQYGNISSSADARPAVTLKSDISIKSGNGTKENPYVVE